MTTYEGVKEPIREEGKLERFGMDTEKKKREKQSRPDRAGRSKGVRAMQRGEKK